MEGFKPIPDSDHLMICSDGRVYDSQNDFILTHDSLVAPRLKTSVNRAKENFVCLCYMINDYSKPNRYREKHLGKIMIQVFLGDEVARKINRSRYIEYNDGNYMNVCLDNLILQKFDRVSKKTKTSNPSRRKQKRSYSKKVDCDASWMTGCDLYF